MLGEVRSFKCSSLVALPNVGIALWMDFQSEPSFREPLNGSGALKLRGKVD
jgi:hypothetical protein